MENLKKWENLFATKGSELDEVLKNKSADPAELLKVLEKASVAYGALYFLFLQPPSLLLSASLGI
jgi:hypothetical protein